MSGSPHLRAVDPGSLEVYPIGREVRLDGNHWTKWQHHRWLASSLYRRASWEIQGMARALFDMAQTESPVGTLPDDEEELAFMLRVTPARLRELKAMEFGPLHNWRRCMADGELRLMHDVVLEQVRDAIERRETRERSNEAKAVAMRLKRIRENWAAQGVDAAVVADEVLIRRVDDWLAGRRRDAAAYEAALLHAGRAGWFNAAAGAVARGGANGVKRELLP